MTNIKELITTRNHEAIESKELVKLFFHFLQYWAQKNNYNILDLDDEEFEVAWDLFLDDRRKALQDNKMNPNVEEFSNN